MIRKKMWVCIFCLLFLVCLSGCSNSPAEKTAENKLVIYDNLSSTNKNVEYPDYLEIEPLKLECQHFVNCCASGQKARSDGENGYTVTKILEEAEKIMLGSKLEQLNQKDFALSRMKV